MNEWDRATEWSNRGNHFMIVVRRSYHEPSPLVGDGRNYWAMYAYIYPEHPMFSEFVPDGDIWQPSTDALNLHGGASLFRTHRADPEDHTKITSYQVGCDYNHLHDSEYGYMDDDSFDDGPIAFDAQRLFDLLSNYKENAA